MNVSRKLYEATFGIHVARATANLPATTQSPLFTITGGRIALLGIVGEVTTIIQAQICNLKLVGNPTVGTDVDICAVLDINAKQVGTLFGITGTFATAMVGANAGAGVLQTNSVVLATGTLDLSTSATNTGAVKWNVWYLPLDSAARLVAA